MTRVLKVSGWVMIGLGALILAFLGYQLVVTNFMTARAQDQAQEALQERYELAQPRIEVADRLPPPPTVVTQPELVPEPEPEPEPIVRYAEPLPLEGEAFGRMKIARLEAEMVLFEGVDRATLKKGPGHMPWTPLPGQPGNAVLSGHRTTYGAPFFDLDRLETGDQIVVETALGSHTYEVRESLIVAPTDVWVTDPKRGAWLTLTTCHPKFSARQRLIIVAELVDGPNLAYAMADKAFVPAQAS